MDSIKWIRSDGTEYSLTGQSDIKVLFDREGFFMPPVSYVEEAVPIEDECSGTSIQEGKTVRRLNIEPREIRMRLRVSGANPAELRQNVRKYMKAFSPLFGDGKLQVTTPDGIVRVLYCRYLDGLKGQENPDELTTTTQTLPLVLIAYDPYFYSEASTSITITEQSTTTSFFPFFPLTLNYAGSFGEVTINNDGDATAYPVWTIYGPADFFKVSNLTTGEAFLIDGNVENGAIIGYSRYATVDARPGNYLIERSDGTNLFEYRSPDSVLFGFQPGENKIRVEIAGPASETKVDLNYQTRHLVV
ncbi:phage tail domain-containing protein [Paenactinomyces guangxiensis]|uniref:Phage tail family protein n=1 Tax=Paenactinomyces guangxiensis TaxID=1490290 RepID=A0A7W2A9C5_9BACL|nr:phage tail domain-containing protein [Paenactinomyces guangxiensis]MBA4495094.1 phage tail family protein [Paenactinomyces guangxiensis]MBH8592222.1 phage tail family protein [Paenactinomyces guangxiensis]